MEAISLKRSIVYAPDNNWQRPLVFRSRTEHLLPTGSSATQTKLNNISEYAKNNGMKINQPKSNVMTFNPVKRNIDFDPKLYIEDKQFLQSILLTNF